LRPPAYVTGEVYRFIAGFTNSAATTLNVNGLGAKAIQYQGLALVANSIVAGRIAEVVYDGTQFELINNQNEILLRELAGVAISGSASDLTAGTLPTARLPTVPIANGGTGQTTALAAFNAIVAAASSIAPSGYIKLQDGLLIQWGAVTFTAVSSVAVPCRSLSRRALFGVVLSSTDATAGTGWSAISLSGFTFGANKSSPAPASTSRSGISREPRACNSSWKPCTATSARSEIGWAASKRRSRRCRAPPTRASASSRRRSGSPC
jgi:hypothetical protein